MSKHKKNTRPAAAIKKPAPASGKAVKSKSGHTMLLRIMIALMLLGTLGFLAAQFLPAGQPAAPNANIPSNNIPSISVPATQTGSQNIPTISTGATPPIQLAGMDRTAYTQGARALTDINKLHGTDITLADGFSAVYSWQSLKLSVWSGAAGNSDKAATLVQQMKDAIGKGNTAFSNVQAVTTDGRTVWQVQGPGGSNYFYQSGSNVVWLTIQAPDTNTASLLKAALQTF